MGEPKLQKNRKYERVNVRIPIRISPKRESHRTYEGEILNLSEGGAYISSDTPFEVGSELSIEFRFAESQKFTTRVVEDRSISTTETAAKSEHPMAAGIVRWQEERTKISFGVEFTDYGDTQSEYLQKVIAYFLQLAKAGVSF